MTFVKGLSAFPITPTDDAGRIDTGALRKLVGRLVSAGVDSIGLLGSTGIYMYLTREERRRAIEVAVDEAGGKVPIIAGIGALRTDDAVRMAQDAKAIGAAGGLLSAASYTPLTEQEVFAHFSTVAGESGLPVVIYDNPATTHFAFTNDLVGRLARTPGIIAIKNPGWDVDEVASRLADQRAVAGDDFSSGCSGDWMATETMIAGADAWYSVLGGVLPNTCLAIVRAAQRGDAAEARRLDAELAPIWALFKQHSSLRVTYALADLLGICRAAPPRPILPLPDSACRQLIETLARLPTHIIR